jgi:hypothetical protein
VKKKRRKRRSRGAKPSQSWARVDEFLDDMRKSETDPQGIRVRDKS